MSLIKWTPFGDVDNFFEDDFIPMVPTMRTFRPEADIYEKGRNLIVEMPLAGIDPEKVDISVEDNTLVVKGTMDETKETEDKNFYRKEVRRGSFHRSLPLPMDVMGDKTSAISENGMLKISLPKKGETKRKKVSVKVKNKKK
ncbi:MAG: Hsp20/alpha crystallin family protein [Elusimicrobiota bacterium]